MLEDVSCNVCGGDSSPLDVVDFNKSCEEANGKFLRMSGNPVYYYLCHTCRFCFAPNFRNWSLQEFDDRIYNKQYVLVDPDYEKKRPVANASNLLDVFKGKQASIRHMDYGGGSGLLSKLLQESGWNSISYDPFLDRRTDLKDLGRFNLITAYEVFEHVPDVNDLMSKLNILIDDNGIILFSTLLSDGQIEPKKRLSWWYASPRNGHISLFSNDSLTRLAAKYNFQCGSFSTGLHVYFRQIPDWASHLLPAGQCT